MHPPHWLSTHKPHQVTILWTLLIATTLTTTACHAREPQPPPQVQVVAAPQPPSPPPVPPGASVPDATTPSPTLKVYAIPAGYEAMLADELQRLFIIGDRPLGKVRQLPNNQLLVLAPEPVHAGVASLLETLQGAPPPATQTQHLDFESRYWFVIATPGDAPDGPGLTPLQDVLSLIEAKQGPLSFTLLDQLAIRGSDSRESQAQSRFARVTQRLFPAQSQDLLGNLSISVHGRPLLDTEIRIRDGQTLVLGQVGYEDPTQPAQPLRLEGAPAPQPAPLLLVISRFDPQPR